MSGNLAIPNTFNTQSGNVPASQLDTNFSTTAVYINNREVTIGTLGARPAAGVQGRWYLATDVAGGTLYVDSGTAWTPGGAGVTSTASVVNQLGGLGLANNGADSVNDIDVAAGMAASDDATFANRILMSLTSAVTKRLDALWAVGTNQGGLDVGTKTSNTWYHLFVIERTDLGTVDAIFTTSALTPLMPANYTKKRRIGAVKTDAASAALIAFSQNGDEFLWFTPVLDVVTAVNPGTAASTPTMSVPMGVKVTAIVDGQADNVTSNNPLLYFSSLDIRDLAPSRTAVPLSNAGFGQTATGWGGTRVFVRTNTSAQIRYRLTPSAGSDVVRISTAGWLDPRGKDA